MLRKTLIALAGFFALSSGAAVAGQTLDGDGNPVPGVFVNRPATTLERSFAGPRKAAPAVTAHEAASWARQSVVH